MAKRRFRIDSIRLVGARERIVLQERCENRVVLTEAELEDIIGSSMDFAVQRRQQKAAQASRVKPTDAEIAATFEAELAKLKGKGKRVKTAAIEKTAEVLGISKRTVERRLSK